MLATDLSDHLSTLFPEYALRRKPVMPNDSQDSLRKSQLRAFPKRITAKTPNTDYEPEI